MTEPNRCRMCGNYPSVTHYEQSIDGNHDLAPIVRCHGCGNDVYLDWCMYTEVERTFRERGRSIYEGSTAYKSKEFTDAITDAVVREWNRRNPE